MLCFADYENHAENDEVVRAAQGDLGARGAQGWRSLATREKSLGRGPLQQELEPGGKRISIGF